MEIPVLIEPVPGIGFRASSGEPFAVVAEAATEEEALAQCKQRIDARLHNGARVTAVTVQDKQHPWLQFAGIYDPDDPLIQEWLRIIEENRQRDEVEEE